MTAFGVSELDGNAVAELKIAIREAAVSAMSRPKLPIRTADVGPERELTKACALTMKLAWPITLPP